MQLNTSTTYTSTTISGLCSGDQVTLKVIPYNGYGNGVESEEINRTTLENYIDGDENVCPSSTPYTVINLPPAHSITWNSSSNITRLSAQGSNPCNFQSNGHGAGWITATTVGSCGETLEIEVNVGTPYVHPEMIEFSCIEGPGYCCTNAIGNEFSFYYEGDYNYFTCKLTNLAETQTLINEFTILGTEGVLVGAVPEGTHTFWIKGTNDCGTATNWSKTSVEFVDCGFGMFSLELIPNPVSYETTVSIKSKNEDILKVDENEEWSIEVYSQNQILKSKVEKLKGSKYTLNTSGWKDGIYFIRAN